MKNLIVKKIVLVIFLIFTFTTLTITTSIYAASTGTLNLSGTVAAICNITINAVTEATQLNITGGESARKVASVDEQSNSITGYKIFMSSANGGELRNTSDATKKTTYTVSYNNGTTQAPTTTPVEVKNKSALTGLTTETSDVKVSVVAFPNAPSGTYTDTITLSIQAN
ncbi:MAG: fimbrial protein [Oligoflexia bacterium]|nr:fimbrial protein [Oligoflexia bacterium]